MQRKFPTYSGGHVIALAGVILLHSGLAAWAMMPEPPVAIPAQQVVQVSMVAPTTIKQDITPKPVSEVTKDAPKAPPKEKGMVKVEPEHKPLEKKKAEKKEEKKKLENNQAQTKLTSGLQSADATDQESAITEPVPASYLKNQPPKYPLSARKSKQQGVVLLEVRVSTDGRPKSVGIQKSSGVEALDVAALEAVKSWQFVPARRGSSVVEASVIVPIEFKLNS
jgi:periplasmic protein TonB